MKRDFGQNNGKGKLKNLKEDQRKVFFREMCKKGLRVAVRKSD